MINRENLTRRQKLVFDQVRRLYATSKRDMAQWMWKTHVQLVAQKSLELAREHNANADLTFCGALLHDLGDIWYERDDAHFETISRLEAQRILKNSGFNSSEIKIILTEIIEPHSCDANNIPKIIEGKILATADAIAHFKTNFYNEVKVMAFLLMSDKEFRDWVNKKLDKDLNRKIFFSDIYEEVRPFYDKLKLRFKN